MPNLKRYYGNVTTINTHVDILHPNNVFKLLCNTTQLPPLNAL
jgi:hypothetical protein